MSEKKTLPIPEAKKNLGLKWGLREGTLERRQFLGLGLASFIRKEYTEPGGRLGPLRRMKEGLERNRDLSLVSYSRKILTKGLGEKGN